MSNILQKAVRAAIAGATISAVSGGALAAGSVASSTDLFSAATGSGDFTSASLGIGGSLSGSSATSKNSFTNNPLLFNSAWGHAGRWFNFELTGDVTTAIRVDQTAGAGWTPGITVYSSGSSIFDGGTPDFSQSAFNSSLGNAPHIFNGTGDIGDFGTGWMSGANGNLVATLAYANSGVGGVNGDYGESILAGVNAKGGELLYSDGVSGSVGAGFAELVFSGMDPGWYTIFIGGADSSAIDTSGSFNVTVSTVPVPAAVWLMGTGLVGLLTIQRRKIDLAT